MTVTPSSFRADFPPFASTSAFPDAGLTFWIGVAGQLLSPSRWGTMLDVGTELFVAHNLALEAQAAQAGASGAPGASSGPVASKAVGPLSKSYDTSVGLMLDGGNYNLTTYGTRFLDLALMFGRGGMQF